MAINLRYQVPADQLAAISMATGEGQYQQAQDRLALEQAALDQRASQFQQELALRQNLAALQNQQQNRQLGANMYQFDAQRQDRAAAAEMDIAARFQQELMRQQGFADMRDFQAEQQQNEQQFRLSQEQSRIKQHYQDQQFNSAIAAAKMIEEAKPTMSPEQYQQALGQWEQRYGDAAGAYPFVGGQNAPQDAEIQGARNILSKWFGDSVTDDMARDYLDLPGIEKIKLGLEAKKLESDTMQAEQQLEVEQQSFEQKLQHELDKHQQKLAAEAEKAEVQRKIDERNHQQQIELERQKAILKMEMELNKPIGYTASDENGGGGKPIFMDEGDKKRILESIGGLSIGGSQPQQSQSGTGGSRQNPVTISGDDEYDALSPGTFFKGPDGITRQK